ncbi:MAG: hypothetical protein K6T61_15570 [Bryobacteraceae bacterium]|nr:hypothetical protein [Bryobacteraceae bacterium]
MRSERNDREQLEHELRGGAYQALLHKLQGTQLFFRRFRTWADVIAFMRDGTSTDPRKDEILRPIFEAHANDADPRWRTILLVIFWPGLESIHFQKRGWDPDADERWQNIIWTFLQVLCRIDVRRRPGRLVQKVYNDTVHRLHDEYRRAWQRADREVAADPEEIEALAGGTEGIDTSGIELREAQEKAIERLRQHMEAGRISEADFLLLAGTRVYGQSVADYARGAGLDYQVAKKRRQRAEAIIRRFEGVGRRRHAI